MNRVQLLKELERYPVFDNKRVRGIINKNENYTKLVIYRLKKAGLIEEIQKNKYTCISDEWAIGNGLVWPSYISLWTSLNYHHMTTQLSPHVFLVTTRQLKNYEIPYKFGKIIFSKVKPSFFFGFERQRLYDFDVLVADSEKTIIDCLYLKKGDSEIFEGIMENIKELNPQKMVDYLQRISNKSIASRVGFMFEAAGIDIHDKIKNLIPDNYVLLGDGYPNKGPKNKKWKVIENVKP